MTSLVALESSKTEQKLLLLGCFAKWEDQPYLADFVKSIDPNFNTTDYKKKQQTEQNFKKDFQNYVKYLDDAEFEQPGYRFLSVIDKNARQVANDMAKLVTDAFMSSDAVSEKRAGTLRKIAQTQSLRLAQHVTEPAALDETPVKRRRTEKSPVLQPDYEVLLQNVTFGQPDTAETLQALVAIAPVPETPEIFLMKTDLTQQFEQQVRTFLYNNDQHRVLNAYPELPQDMGEFLGNKLDTVEGQQQVKQLSQDVIKNQM